MVFDAEPIRQKYINLFKKRLNTLKNENLAPPALAVVLVGEDPASAAYVATKQKLAQELDVKFYLHHFRESVILGDLVACIEKLNENPEVSGIIVQLPLPAEIDAHVILNKIAVEKDVDGLTDKSLGALFAGRPFFVPCTPLAVLKILEEAKIPTEGRHVVIVGRSSLVGRPLANLLSSTPYNATVTLVHSKTRYMDVYTRMASIVILAAGAPSLLRSEMISDGVTVIDIGITRQNGKLVGDANYASVAPKAGFITPVPRGVGVVTVLMLLYNTIKASYLQQGLTFSEIQDF